MVASWRALTLGNLGAARRAQGDLDGAIARYDRAVAAAELATDGAHPITVGLAMERAEVLRERANDAVRRAALARHEVRRSGKPS